MFIFADKTNNIYKVHLKGHEDVSKSIVVLQRHTKKGY